MVRLFVIQKKKRKVTRLVLCWLICSYFLILSFFLIYFIITLTFLFKYIYILIDYLKHFKKIKNWVPLFFCYSLQPLPFLAYYFYFVIFTFFDDIFCICFFDDEERNCGLLDSLNMWLFQKHIYIYIYFVLFVIFLWYIL